MYDLAFSEARVLKVIKKKNCHTELDIILSSGEKGCALNYPRISGNVEVGDRVLVNTTAVILKLGTGGYHFVIANLKNSQNSFCKNEKGHIMKMRYTPLQIRTRCAEEKGSHYHHLIEDFTGFNGSFVFIIPLHSLLAPLLAVYRYFYPEGKAVYIMTEGGALPLDFSNQVYNLKKEGFLDKTVTVGHCFGGDYEAVNIFTGLIIAKEIEKADLIVAGMGPGMVGTDTKYGYSGVENAFINYAVNNFDGRSILIPRISFADKRPRHYGLSHHTETLISNLVKDGLYMAFPGHKKIFACIQDLKIFDRHHIFFYNSCEIELITKILKNVNIEFDSMGHGIEEDPLFFVSAGLAVLYWDYLTKNKE